MNAYQAWTVADIDQIRQRSLYLARMCPDAVRTDLASITAPVFWVHWRFADWENVTAEEVRRRVVATLTIGRLYYLDSGAYFEVTGLDPTEASGRFHYCDGSAEDHGPVPLVEMLGRVRATHPEGEPLWGDYLRRVVPAA